MKKVIAIIVMGIIIGVYILSIKNTGETKKTVLTNLPPVSERLQVIKEEIEEHYPATPKEVIEKHNELMEIGYSTDIKDEDFEAYAQNLRMLYTKQLQELNPLEEQVNKLIAERILSEDKPLIIITSEIEDITIVKDSSTDEEKSAEAIVKHGTNKGSTIKKYRLIKEDGMWKIQAWETQKSEDADVEE